jgi:hypothetical protein
MVAFRHQLRGQTLRQATDSSTIAEVIGDL